VQELTQRLADAVVAEHESLADEDLGGVEALHIQVVFDLQLCLDVLMVYVLSPSSLCLPRPHIHIRAMKQHTSDNVYACTQIHTCTHARTNMYNCITPLRARVCARARERERACSLTPSLPPFLCLFLARSLTRARSLSSSLFLSLPLSQGHELGSSLAARAKALEQRLLKRVDPIDYSFLAPLLHTNRSKAYQRHSVMLGALVQVNICRFFICLIFLSKGRAAALVLLGALVQLHICSSFWIVLQKIKDIFLDIITENQRYCYRKSRI
jgi:hypothetical protein